ncbi:MAG: hypothetical protein QGI24_09210 [Kiritimatiellia bacterium]|jgi:type II secretory pathway pseudopilin PulG|nr:hypothetical protein [Kiritimatiellia bacterium]MDP6848952.1 hypothetical protein [Kiritimatiellia bacterium]
MREKQKKGGFTIVETLVASSISTLTAAACLTTFIWTMKRCVDCRQYCWAVTETRETKENVIAYMRNACEIVDIDDAGDWVELEMADGTISRFEYMKPGGQSGSGRLVFTRNMGASNPQVTLVAEGFTKTMNEPVRNVFEQTGPTTLRVAYRVSEPLSPGTCAVEVDTGVQIRNWDG